AKVDHRLDREEHAGPELGPRSGAAGVDDFRAVVEHAPYAMAAEIPHHTVSVGFGMALDGVGDVAEMIAGPGLLQAEHQAFVGDVDELAGAERNVADEVHAARIAVPAID